ncbi:hypothetical protein [uncultured Adlercreutzia sp.]|uniref:hypothetical protein n=1 Tax=uncultured Adlercreutzia sp. TaxID=875803 RepID=UPI0026F3AA17|nr:hypothetical protein [uncultured Adlercreutzia sp.]
MDIAGIEHHKIARHEFKGAPVADQRALPLLHEPYHVVPMGMRRKRLHHPTIPPPLPNARQRHYDAFGRFPLYPIISLQVFRHHASSIPQLSTAGLNQISPAQDESSLPKFFKSDYRDYSTMQKDSVR